MAAPIKNTCPDIDSIIKDLKCIQSSAKQGMKENDRDTDNYQLFKDCEWDIDSIISRLEDLRIANATLRGWGEDLETEFSWERTDLEEQINKLEEDLKKANDEYSLLEADHNQLIKENGSNI